MDELTFSIATSSHQSAILDILNETQKWLWGKGLNQWTLPFEVEWIKQSIDAGEFFVVKIDQEIVAVFRLTETDSMWEEHFERAIYIHSLAVRSSWHGHNIGLEIMKWIEAYATQNQKRCLRLDCMADNEILCRYYMAIGFVKRRIVKIENDDSVYKAQLFEKTLTSF